MPKLKGKRESIALMDSKQDKLNLRHKLKIPVTNIIGFSVLLSKEKLTAEQKRYAKIIQDEARSLQKMIDSL